MNDDDLPVDRLTALKAEHRCLDDQIKGLLDAGCNDQLELARLKKRKLKLKDEIQMLSDRAVPDIIA